MNNTELRHLKTIYSNPLSWIHKEKRPQGSLSASATCRGIINSWLAKAYKIDACHDTLNLTGFERKLFSDWGNLSVIFTCMAAQRHRSYLLQTDYRTLPNVVTSFMKLNTGITLEEKQHAISRLTLNELTYGEVLSLKTIIPVKTVNLVTLLFAACKSVETLPEIEFNMQLFGLAQQHVAKQR